MVVASRDEVGDSADSTPIRNPMASRPPPPPRTGPPPPPLSVPSALARNAVGSTVNAVNETAVRNEGMLSLIPIVNKLQVRDRAQTRARARARARAPARACARAVSRRVVPSLLPTPTPTTTTTTTTTTDRTPSP